MRRKDSLCAQARRFYVSRKGGTGGGGWGLLQGAVHMAAVRLGCKSNMVGTGLVNSRPGCMSRLLLSPFRGFISGREGFLGSKQVFANRQC